MHTIYCAILPLLQFNDLHENNALLFEIDGVMKLAQRN